ncbi:MAG TPA: YggT family protein [Gemmatimonadales bacterium]|nr:YggT family protein [Gemmatimonadales bacterium]
MIDLAVLLRYAVLAAVAVLVLGAFGAMAVQARLVNPFGRLARAIRAVTDPALTPLERRILRSGGNPQSAPWWLAGIAVVGGIVLISAVEWGADQARSLASAATLGPGYALRLAVYWAFNAVILALVVRVVGSWIGASRYTPWMRPFVFLTEWLLAPLRRIVPPLGMFDITPLVAWFVLQLVRDWVVHAL